MQLDTDVTGGQGPETMTINRTEGVSYVVVAHHFSGGGILTDSEARLQLLSGDLDETIAVPRLHSCDSNPVFWRAFGIDGQGQMMRFGSSSTNEGFLVVEEDVAKKTTFEPA